MHLPLSSPLTHLPLDRQGGVGCREATLPKERDRRGSDEKESGN